MVRAPIDDNHHKGLVVADAITGATKVLTSTDVNGDPALNIYSLGGELVAGTDFDYLGVVATNSTTDTLTYKLGGAGGITAQVLVVTYTSSVVEKISDSFSVLAWS